jgi:peptidyl-prolyl cis-trans isomerase SurA
MKSLTFSLFFSFFCFIVVTAQYSPNDQLLTIGNRKVTCGEFERIFNKNYNVNTSEKQSVETYFSLFLKFELKVTAAIDAGIDTLTSFKNELKGYRNQLAKSYLTDNEMLDKLVLEAYDRTENEVNVSHIMIRLPENPTPADTAKAYTKIFEVHKQLVAGQSFEKLALEFSEDPSVKQNQGKVGYLGAFRIPSYAFENAAYNTKVGGISMPFRTRFGYHIVKVNDKRPSPGEVKIAHVMIAVPQGSDDALWNKAKTKIDSLYHVLEKGEDFGQLARQYSDDRNSGNKGGELPWFSSGRMVPEFEEASFALKTKGELSHPVKTAFGWHILKLIDKHEVPKFEQVKNDLKTKVLQSDRADIINNHYVARLKKEYSHKINEKNFTVFYTLDSTIYHGNVSLPASTLAKPLLTIEKRAYTGNDFREYLASTHFPEPKSNLKDYMDQSFKSFVNQSFIQYQNDHLELKYAEFDNLVKEYHDGILLFDIMDAMVWTKASRDSAGLQSYYDHLSIKPTWGERLDAAVFTCKTKNDVEKIKKFISVQEDNLFTDDQLVKAVCDSAKGFDCVKIEQRYFARGENQFIDSIAWKQGFTGISSQNDKVIFAFVKGVRAPEIKKLEDIRGIITADYQNYIEENWIKELNTKYKVVVNDGLLHQIANKYKDTH